MQDQALLTVPPYHPTQHLKLSLSLRSSPFPPSEQRRVSDNQGEHLQPAAVRQSLCSFLLNPPVEEGGSFMIEREKVKCLLILPHRHSVRSNKPPALSPRIQQVDGRLEDVKGLQAAVGHRLHSGCLGCMLGTLELVPGIADTRKLTHILNM